MERRLELKHDKIIQLNAFTRNITRLKKQSDLFFLHFIVILDMHKCKHEGYVLESSSPSILSKNEQEKNRSSTLASILHAKAYTDRGSTPRKDTARRGITQNFFYQQQLNFSLLLHSYQEADEDHSRDTGNPVSPQSSSITLPAQEAHKDQLVLANTSHGIGSGSSLLNPPPSSLPVPVPPKKMGNSCSGSYCCPNNQICSLL